MKKSILLFAITFTIVACANAQINSVPEKEKKENASEKKFSLGLGLGVGSLVEEPSIINAGINMQGEFKAATNFSLYSDLGYHRLFSLGDEGSLGYASWVVGPRGYISPKFFIGVGGGLAFFSLEGESATVFNYSPHIGYNGKSMQMTLGYNGLTNDGENIGFVQLKTTFKFGK